MISMDRLIYLIIAILSAIPFGAEAAKTVKIRLTGSTYEPILMTVGQSGRTEVLGTLPYILEVPKDQLPLKLRFQSENYLYYDIDVPKKPFDTTGHVYLVKINESAMALRGSVGGNSQNTMPSGKSVMGQSTLDTPVVGIDVTQGVNAAPVTGIRNDKTFALIITNQDYEMTAPVDNATDDGLAFKEYCIRTLGIPAENVRYGANLSYGKMKKAFNDMLDLVAILNGDASLIVYYAGHGIPDNKTRDAYILPVDADGTDTDVCMSLSDIYSRLNQCPLNQCVVFLDACFSGSQRGDGMIVAARGVRLKPKEAAPAGKTIVFSATSGDETAFSYAKERHGLFTYHLLHKLQESKGKVTLGELADHLSRQVALDSRRINNSPQTPSVSVAPGLEADWKKLRLTR